MEDMPIWPANLVFIILFSLFVIGFIWALSSFGVVGAAVGFILFMVILEVMAR